MVRRERSTAELRLPPSAKELPRDKLFRALLRTPRPRWPIDFRVVGAEHIPLHVVAPAWHEEMDMVDSPGGLQEADFVVAVLYTPRGRAFRSPADMRRLPEAEYWSLAEAVLRGMRFIAPSRGRSDWAAWKAALREGAQHPSNHYEVSEIGTVGTMVAGPRAADFFAEADRYFGLPIRELTDGQRLAHEVACEVWKQMRGR